jgi:hypothetical protein
MRLAVDSTFSDQGSHGERAISADMALILDWSSCRMVMHIGLFWRAALLPMTVRPGDLPQRRRSVAGGRGRGRHRAWGSLLTLARLR